MPSLEMVKYFKNNINKSQLNTQTIFFYNGNLWIHGLQGNLKIKSINFHYLTLLVHWVSLEFNSANLSSIMSKYHRY